MELPDDAEEWNEEWAEEVGKTYEEQIKQSLIEANYKLSQMNVYLDELYELNGTSLSWNAAIVKMKAIIMERS